MKWIKIDKGYIKLGDRYMYRYNKEYLYSAHRKALKDVKRYYKLSWFSTYIIKHGKNIFEV